MRNINLVVVSILILAVGVAWGQSQGDKGKAVQVYSDFEFKVEMDEKSVIFSTVHGTEWVGLSWAVGDDSPMEFWLDESGIASRAEDLTGSRFLIHFESSPVGAIMRCNVGTGWKELGFGCGEDKPCNYLVNENGVKSLI